MFNTNYKKEQSNFDEIHFNRKKAERFTKFLNVTFKSISITGILIIITIFVLAFILIYGLFYIHTPKNVLKSLKEEYRGEKFVIVDNNGAENNKSRGLYIISPKNNLDIKFKMYNSNQFRSDNDYSGQRTKYYFEKCPDGNLKNNFCPQETIITYNGIEFLQYTIIANINNYYEIENKVNAAYKLAQYFLSQDNKMYEGIFIENSSINYHFFITIDTQNSLEQEIYCAKYEYIKALKTTNSNLINQIEDEEIKNIWKPTTLSLYINDKEVGKVKYDPVNKSYFIDGLNGILNSCDEIKITKINNYSKEIKQIEYNKKKYKVVSEEKQKNNIIYDNMPLDNLCQMLNAKIDYDYNNEKVYMTLQ